MSRTTLSFVGAIGIGVSAGVAWIVLSGPILRLPEPGTTTDSQTPPARVETIEASPSEPTSAVAEREVVPGTTPRIKVASTAIQQVSEEDPRVVLFGMVTEADGHAQAASQSLYVEVTNDQGKRVLSKIEAGRYSVAGLEPGDWKLSFRSPGFRDLERQVTLSPSEALHREDFVLERAWSIAIQVQTPEGKDLSEIQPETPRPRLCAIATKDPPGDRLPATDLTHYVDYGIGRFLERFDSADLPKEAIGSLVVLQPPPVHVSLVARQFVIETKRIDTSIESLTFTVSSERLRALASSLVLRVADAETSQPIGGAIVQFSTPDRVEMGPKSSEDGLVRFDQRVPGQYSIQIIAAGYAMESRLLDLEPGRETDLGTIPLSRPNAFGGRIVDSEGHPVAAQPSLHPYFENDPGKTLAHTLSTFLHVDSDGRFHDKRHPAGRYLLLFGAEIRNPPAQNEPEWTVAPVVIDTRSGPTEDLEIVLARGAELRLKPTSKEVVGMSFRIMTPEGLPYRHGNFYDTSAKTLRIAPGAYDLVLGRDSTDLRHVPIRLGAGGSSLDIDP